MNKKGFVARDWVIAAVLFSGVIALFILAVADLGNEYGNPNVVDANFQSKFDKFDENVEFAEEIWNKTSGEDGISTIGTFEVLFKSTFGVISLVFSSVTLAGTQMFGFTEYFGIPAEVGFVFFTILFALLAVMIAFIIISSVNRRDL